MSKDHIYIWNQCLDIIKRQIVGQPFKTWFEPVKPVSVVKNILTIQVPNKFFYEWLEEHYVSELKTAIRQVLGPSGSLEYQIMVENHRQIGTKSPEAQVQGVSNYPEPKMMNPFVIPGIKKIKIE